MNAETMIEQRRAEEKLRQSRWNTLNSLAYSVRGVFEKDKNIKANSSTKRILKQGLEGIHAELKKEGRAPFKTLPINESTDCTNGDLVIIAETYRSCFEKIKTKDDE